MKNTSNSPQLEINGIPLPPQEFMGAVAGRALLTFFVVNDDWRRKVKAGERFIIDFAHSGDGYLTADPGNPESVIAFEQNDAIRMLTDAGLVIEEVSLGILSGNPGWIGQDSILVSKR